VGPTSRTGAGRATSSIARTSFGIDEDAKMSTAWGTTGCLLASSCVESVGLMLEAAIAGTESGAPAGAGLPIMGAPMEEDLASCCSVENSRDPEDDGPRSSACKGLVGKGARR
jgi:hypothetical protein